MIRRMMLAIAAGAALGPWSVGCDSTSEREPGAGGASMTTTGQGEGGEVCNIPPDGWCNEANDCRCALCQGSAQCMEGGCRADGVCMVPLDDSCTCSDCDWDPMCNAPDRSQCEDDGVCDYLVEGCGCADCLGVATCADNVDRCAGGAPDQLCEPAMESCGCPDCLGRPECLCEEMDMSFCVCPSNWFQPFCLGQDSCYDDGVCDWYHYFEGCQCVDCVDLPVCEGYSVQ